MTVDWAVIISIVAAAVSVGTFVRGWIRDKPDIAREYQDMATKAAQRITELQVCVDVLEKKVDELEIEVKKRDRQIEEWSAGIELLINQLIINKQEPIWRPKR